MKPCFSLSEGDIYPAFCADLALGNVNVVEENNHCGYRLVGPHLLLNASAGPCPR